jgi:hypothetical protein
MSDEGTILVGDPANFRRSADGQIRFYGNTGIGFALGDDAVYYPVGIIIIPDTLRGDGSMADNWGDPGDAEYVLPGSRPGSPVPAAPAGGWCFKTINGKLTAVACNASSSSTPQGTILSSSDTRAIQQALNSKIGAGLAVDGNFGPKTAAAVRTFQARNGLSQSGVVDSQTRALLFAAQAVARTTPTAGAQPNLNTQPPPGSSFSLSSLFSGIDTTTLLMIAGVAAVALATRGD